MKDQHRILLGTFLVGVLALGSSVGTPWAQLQGLTNLTEGGKQIAIAKLKEGAKQAKAELQARLEKEMRTQLAKEFKKIDEELEQQLKKLDG